MEIVGIENIATRLAELIQASADRTREFSSDNLVDAFTKNVPEVGEGIKAGEENLIELAKNFVTGSGDGEIRQAKIIRAIAESNMAFLRQPENEKSIDTVNEFCKTLGLSDHELIVLEPTAPPPEPSIPKASEHSSTPTLAETGFLEGQFINPRTESIFESFMSGNVPRTCIKGGSVALGCIAGMAAYNSATKKSAEDDKTHPLKALMYGVPAVALTLGGLLMRGEAKIHK